MDDKQLGYLALAIFSAAAIANLIVWMLGGRKRPQTRLVWAIVWLEVVVFLGLIICWALLLWS